MNKTEMLEIAEKLHKKFAIAEGIYIDSGKEIYDLNYNTLIEIRGHLSYLHKFINYGWANCEEKRLEFSERFEKEIEKLKK